MLAMRLLAMRSIITDIRAKGSIGQSKPIAASPAIVARSGRTLLNPQARDSLPCQNIHPRDRECLNGRNRPIFPRFRKDAP